MQQSRNAPCPFHDPCRPKPKTPHKAGLGPEARLTGLVLLLGYARLTGRDFRSITPDLRVRTFDLMPGLRAWCLPSCARLTGRVFPLITPDLRVRTFHLTPGLRAWCWSSCARLTGRDFRSITPDLRVRALYLVPGLRAWSWFSRARLTGRGFASIAPGLRARSFSLFAGLTGSGFYLVAGLRGLVLLSFTMPNKHIAEGRGSRDEQVAGHAEQVAGMTANHYCSFPISSRSTLARASSFMRASISAAYPLPHLLPKSSVERCASSRALGRSPIISYATAML